jgi:hypothetical protein
LQNAKPKPHEIDNLRRYSQITKKPVVFIPEVGPIDYPSGKQIQGWRYPEGVLDGELFDYQHTAKSTSIDHILQSFEGKDSQATKIFKELSESSVGIAEVSKRIDAVWANPKILNIDTIILFDGLTAVTHTRPNSYIPSFALETARLFFGQAERMAGLVEQTEAEPL